MPNLETVQGDLRILVLAPTARDGEITVRLLKNEKLEPVVCPNIEQLCEELRDGAGAVLIAEEFLYEKNAGILEEALRYQPAWSDVPILILTLPSQMNLSRLREWQQSANVTLIQRPLKIAEFVSTVRSRLQDRKRQYVVKRLLGSLDQRSREFQQLANAMPQMVFITDDRGQIEFLSQRAESYLGRNQNQLMSFPPKRLIHSDDRARTQSRWTKAVDRQQPFHCEFRVLKSKTQKHRWHLARAEPVFDRDGELIRWYATCTDIHQRKLAEVRLSAALDKSTAASIAKSEFLANMSHEIRTPMTSILGYAELLADQENDPEKQRLLHVIQQNGGFLLDIINDILDLSKIEAGKLEISCENFDLAQFIESTVALLRIRAQEKDIQFNVEISENCVEQINTDPKRLRQILVNLLGNSIKFTDSGTVTLKVKRDGNQLEFIVRDTGVGMDKVQLERLFQPFQQGDASISRRFGGTGLGLTISQRLASMLGGSISVESELDRGSVFTLSMNVESVTEIGVREGDTEVLRSTAPVISTELPVLNCRVLVVDDRRDVRFLTTSFLTEAGADVINAENGLEAVNMIEELDAEGSQPDLVLMDMQMPTMDGYQAASRLRAMGFSQPIIALTADAMHGDMTRCLESGCNAYLSKPIDKKELLSMIAEHLA